MKVSFDYIDWIKLGFGPSGKETTICIKSLVLYEETEYEINKVKRNRAIY
ncbi:hypothetical protein ACVXZY_14475 [Staphylococcus aureus]